MIIKTTREVKKIAFFGDAEAKHTEEHFILAKNTAKLLAEKGYGVVNGGGPGIMLASSLGAKLGGGKVELVMVDGRKNMGDYYEGQAEDNLKLADKVLRLDSYPERLNKLLEEADAYIVFKGGTGTVAEMGFVWSEAKLYQGKHKPVILAGEFWKKIMEPMDKYLAIDKNEMDLCPIAKTAEEVVEILNVTLGL